MNTTSLTPLDKTSLRSRVTKSLRAAILSGELRPGEVYSAPTLGARLGVSATPVREAMINLAREGLVEMLPNRGFRVIEVDDKYLDDIEQLRLLLEPPLVRQAVGLIPERDLPVIRELAQRIVDGAERGDLTEYGEADHAFHIALLDYVGNPRITTLVSELRGQTRLLGLTAMVERGELADSAREHLRIVDLIERGDEEGVEQLMRDHIAQTRGRWAGR